MSVFSYPFFILWAITSICYYTFAKRWQWQILLLASVLFYALSIDRFPAVLLCVWLVSYAACFLISQHQSKIRLLILLVSICFCIAALSFGRVTSIVALLGNSYFVLKAIGCVIDAYREKGTEKNILRYLLYLIYWPGVLEGPFNRIQEFRNQLDNRIEFDYVAFTHGIQRFVWGVFKKLFIAERLELIVTAIMDKPEGKGGIYILIGIVAYAVQIYADFSGFMDMMLGLSSSFGIKLPENFKQPYFSKSIPEFWRRWHITLGLWFRDYVMFPFTSNTTIKRISKTLRKKNKSIGKLLPLITGTCIVWFFTGLWHGFSKNYLVWALYYAVLICCSQIYNEFGKSQKNVKNGFYDSLRILRTICLVLIADSFICVQGISNIRILWKELLFNFTGGTSAVLSANGLVIKDYICIAIGCLLMVIVSLLKERGIGVQEKLDKTPIVFRWSIYYLLIYAILLFGLYGSQYDASQFLYMQF